MSRRRVRLLMLLWCTGTADQAQPLTPADVLLQSVSVLTGSKYAFEVVSIRPKKEFSPGVPEVGPTADGWRMVDNGLAFAILHAYVPTTGATFYTNEQVVGLPEWTKRESYEIRAKVGEADLTDWNNPSKQPAMLRSMLEAMLMERCKMTVHRDTKEVTVLALVLGKKAQRFKRSVPNETHGSGAPLPGGGVVVPEDGGKALHIYGAPVSSLASLFSNMAKQPVQDRTGLTGAYDLVIPNLTMLAALAARQENGEASEPGPTIFSLVEDLGLKLESAKGKVETLVIDHIERPTGN